MKTTFATLALIALTNAVGIREAGHVDSSVPEDSTPPNRDELASPSDCAWLAGDRSNPSEEQQAMSEFWDEGDWYCKNAAHCWATTPDDQNEPTAETAACLKTAFESQDVVTAADADAVIHPDE